MKKKETATESQKRKLPPYKTKKIGLPSPSNKRGWFRKGAWRPTWTITEETRARMKVNEAKRKAQIKMDRRITKNSMTLLNAQLSLATGCQSLFVKKAILNSKGNPSGKYEKPVCVRDEATIIDYLDWNLNNEHDEYYYMTMEKPDNRAINDLFDRWFGKVKQEVEAKVEHSGNVSIANIYNISQKIQNWDIPNQPQYEEDIEEAEILDDND